MKIAKFQYKCRQCGMIEENPRTPVENAMTMILSVVFAIEVEKPKIIGSPVTMTSIHPCGDGNCGVSDLIGFKVEE